MFRGIDLAAIMRELEDEGVTGFAKSFRAETGASLPLEVVGFAEW
jgi:hypothetical protein